MPKKEQPAVETTEFEFKALSVTKTTEVEQPKAPIEEKLFPFGVIIDGQDRTIMAKDQEDLQRRIEKLRSL